MIVADRKPFDELYEHAKRHKKVLLLGCGTCVTVCMTGGEKEVGILASQFRLAAKEHGDDIEVVEHTITRQCDEEFFDEATARKVVDRGGDHLVGVRRGRAILRRAVSREGGVSGAQHQVLRGDRRARRVVGTLRRLRPVHFSIRPAASARSLGVRRAC